MNSFSMFVRALPNTITLLNLLLGSLACVLLVKGNYTLACWMVAGAALADFLDGAVARLLKVSSPLGVQLDSLADMVSFGLVPGLIYYRLLAEAVNYSGDLYWPGIPAFLVTLFSALRLGKFNLDERQSEGFIGMPTPASTILAIGLLLVFVRDTMGLGGWVANPWLLYPVVLLVSWLLVAEFPMFSLKFKNISWKGNEIRIIFTLISAIFLLIFQEAGLVLTIGLYVFLSFFYQVRVPHEVSGGN